MVKQKRNILILCEGQEEWFYVKKLLSFPVFNNELYNFAEPINVKGIGNIPPRFQIEYNRGRYDLILIFCDGDNNSSQFQEIKNQISLNIFGCENLADKFFIFVNPVTLQVVLLHYANVTLTHKSKKDNAIIVEKVTSIKQYNAREDQITEMINGIHFRSYTIMKNRLKLISTSVEDIPSTNMLYFLDKFESNDDSWIDEIMC